MDGKNDWGSFVVRINVNASRQRLYSAWATREGMESWFLRVCNYARKNNGQLLPEEFAVAGNQFTWLWHGWSDDTVEKGEILEANGSDLFQFSFGKAGICTVRILMAGDEQIIELRQDSIPTDEESRFYFHIGCKTGWTFYLTNLKSILEGGIDLRNKDVNLQNMLNS